MSHTFSNKSNKLYRYYLCDRANKHGRGKCPSPSLPANELEQFVIDQVKSIGHDPGLIRETLEQARVQAQFCTESLLGERKSLKREHSNLQSYLAQLSKDAFPNDAELANANERALALECRMSEVEAELQLLSAKEVSEAEVVQGLADFASLWESLTPREQQRVIDLLIERVSYDGRTSKLTITYCATGIRTLALQAEDAA